MSKTAFAKIAAGLEDAAAYIKGDTARGVTHAPIDARQVRAATGKTQAAFARTYRLPVATVQDWEQKRRAPDAPARAYLALIAAAPDTVERIMGQIPA